MAVAEISPKTLAALQAADGLHHVVIEGQTWVRLDADHVIVPKEPTEEMIKDGMTAFCAYDSNYETPREAVEQIYEAMHGLVFERS